MMKENPDGSFEWVGLSDCLKNRIDVFSDAEIARYLVTFLKVVLSKLHSPKEELKDH